MPELSTAPTDSAITGAEKLLTLDFENVTVQKVADFNESKSADLASAATTDLSTATAAFVHVTGTTTITALGTAQAGTRRIAVFDGVLTLTHNATSLILPTGANIATAAGDVATFVSEGGGNWRCVDYTRADGTPLAGGAVVLDAGDIGIADAGGYFTGTDVEAALQELGASGVGGGGVANEYGTATISSGAIDLSDETVAVWLVTLNANITSITYPTALSGEVLSPVVIFTQDGTGGRTVTGWPTTTWESGSAPTINSAAGSVTSVPLLVLGNGTVYGVS